MSAKVLKAIDICSGGGGWACAARGLPIEITMAIDLWEPACKTYKLNHPGTEVIQADLRDMGVRARVMMHAADSGCELVVGGIPCEWLSKYRTLQKVTSEERAAQRDTLDSCLSLVDSIDPRFWCLEDVEQLIPELPIMSPYVKLDARHWSPQRRKRVFVGKFPKPPRAKCEQVLRDRLLPGPYRIGTRLSGRTPQRSRTFTNATCLAAELDRKAPTVLAICSRRDAEVAVVDPGIPGGMRNFEWQELALLQGFPRDYVFYGSPTDVMKQVGRAIQIDLGREILRGIVRKWES